MCTTRNHLLLLFITTLNALSAVNASEDSTQYPPLELSCPGEYDVVVMLDRSEKVDEETFAAFIDLIKKLLYLFDIREDGNHFGLVLYNDNPQVIMKLNENNDVSYIKNYLMTNLPSREGRRNARRAMRTTRRQLLTPAMGDRPDVTNVCLVITSQYGVRPNNKQFTKIKEVCDKFAVLHRGGDTDLEKVHDKVCPAVSSDEAGEETNNPSSGCPQSYTTVGEYCFQALTTFLSFDQSIAECQKTNGRLITTDTAEKNEAVMQFVTSLGMTGYKIMYIGLRDETGDNQDFRWLSDNSALTFSNWDDDQPSAAAEQCGAISVGDSGPQFGSWVDEACFFQLNGAICETDPTL